MTSLPAGIGAQQALTQQNFVLSAVKQSAEADQAIANILDQTVQASSTRGTILNTTA